MSRTSGPISKCREYLKEGDSRTTVTTILSWGQHTWRSLENKRYSSDLFSTHSFRRSWNRFCWHRADRFHFAFRCKCYLESLFKNSKLWSLGNRWKILCRPVVPLFRIFWSFILNLLIFWRNVNDDYMNNFPPLLRFPRRTFYLNVPEFTN